MACIELDGEFCFPQYTNASQQLFGANGAISAAGLEGLCTPCTSKIMDYIGLSSESDIGIGFYMDMLCTKIESKFCYPSFATMTSRGDAPMTLGEQEAVLCEDPCVPSIFMKYDNYLRSQPPPSADGDQPEGPSVTVSYGRLIEAFCSNDGSADNDAKGKSCIQAMGWSMFGNRDMPPLLLDVSVACGIAMDGDGPPPAPAVCGAACASAFGRLTAAWGCCLNSFASAMGPRAGVMPFFQDMQARCATAPIRPACGVSALAEARALCVGMPNLNYAYYTAWRADVSAAVVLSVSLYAGVPPTRIRVVADGRVDGLGGLGDGTVVCVEVQGYTFEQSAALQLLIDGIGAGGGTARRSGASDVRTLRMVAVSSFPAVSRLEPREPVLGDRRAFSGNTSQPGTPTPSPFCPAPPLEICCTRVLAAKTTAISVQLSFVAALSSITLWVDSPAGDGGAIPSLHGLDISIGSRSSMTGCALMDPRPPPSAGANGGFDSMTVVCGSVGTVLHVVMPHSVLHDAPTPPSGPVMIKACTVNVTAPTSDVDLPSKHATLLFRR